MYTESIILFTRYPTLGQVKTRLIPELGEERATALHKEMTELCLYQTLELGVPVQIHYAGDNELDMQNWIFGLEEKFNSFDFKTKISFQVQADGELGHKMEQAFRFAFAKLYKKMTATQARLKV